MADTLRQIEGRLTDAVTEKDHALGPASAPVTLVEYGDYECPSCLNALPMVHLLKQRYGDRLRFVFRHFPRSSIHPHASVAAQAAEAAGDQGKFWDMHETLFRHQHELGEVDFSHLALSIGLEIYNFESSMTREIHRRHIGDDYASGERSGVTQTPTFFINGLRFNGTADPEAMSAEIERAVKATNPLTGVEQ